MVAVTSISALEKIQVLYMDDRDDRHPDRWRIYRYRIQCGSLEIFTKVGWDNVGLPETLQVFQKFGYTHSIYGFLSKEPSAPPQGFSTNPRFLKEFGFLSEDHYGPACAVLGLSWPVNKEQIKQAYRKKSKQVHPDIGGSADEFNAVQEAYEVLLDAVEGGKP